MEKDRLIDLSDIEKKQKKEAVSNLLDSPMATSNRVPGLRLRTDEITSPTVSIVYLIELKYVNKALNIHYPYFPLDKVIRTNSKNSKIML